MIWHPKQFMYTTCSEFVVFMYWTCRSMNNLFSYCGLVDARIRVSNKDLPVGIYQKVASLARWRLLSFWGTSWFESDSFQSFTLGSLGKKHSGCNSNNRGCYDEFSLFGEKSTTYSTSYITLILLTSMTLFLTIAPSSDY